MSRIRNWHWTEKAALAIVLAVLVFFLTHVQVSPSGNPTTDVPIQATPLVGMQEHLVISPLPDTVDSEAITTVVYLRKTYQVYNEAYFRNRLPKDPIIDFEGILKGRAAETWCDGDLNCEIHFRKFYVAAPRFADLALLHEMCHIQAWGLDDDNDGHGPKWRACMMNLDLQGAWRTILIDRYWEGK
jgi:hypothetical protein